MHHPSPYSPYILDNILQRLCEGNKHISNYCDSRRGNQQAKKPSKCTCCKYSKGFRAGSPLIEGLGCGGLCPYDLEKIYNCKDP